MRESGPFCREHRREKWKKEDEDRGGTDPFYTSVAWRNMRKLILSAHPLCVSCGALATTVDHIRPRRQGGADLDLNNLQSLCRACHDIKRAKEAHA
jgi:5-methylcytosine-specific restriction protein A